MQITREMLFPLAFYKKAKFNGSKGKRNYRIEKITEDDKDYFLLSIFNGPDCYDETKEKKETMRFPFSDDGMEEIMSYLNQM